LFDEVIDGSRATQAARETVSFGLECLAQVSLMNQKTGRCLSCRAGVDSGVVVAGIVDAGQPLFEVFGPAVTGSKELEQSGVMQRVQCSRAVYRQVYTFFTFRENGTSGGQVVYLVSKK
jgi:class 3 adenylate cyclase